MRESWVIAAAVNDAGVLAANLARSPIVASGVRLLTETGHRSASSAYVAAAARMREEICIFAHQDVYLPAGWTDHLRAALARLESADPNWGVLGVIGVRADGQVIGRAWSSGLRRELGGEFAAPQPCVSVDELLIVVRRSSGLTFDPAMPAFHLYGTDIVQSALAGGFGAYVIHAPVIHNSRPVRRLDASYWAAYQYLRRKWRDRLPIPTCVLPLSRSPWPRMRYWLRDLRRSARMSPVPAPRPDAVAVARRLGYESFESAEPTVSRHAAS